MRPLRRHPWPAQRLSMTAQIRHTAIAAPRADFRSPQRGDRAGPASRPSPSKASTRAALSWRSTCARASGLHDRGPRRPGGARGPASASGRRFRTPAGSSPQRRVTVNLAPADLRKAGPGFDLAIACGDPGGERPGPRRRPCSKASRCSVSCRSGGEVRACRGALAVARGGGRRPARRGRGGRQVRGGAARGRARMSGGDDAVRGPSTFSARRPAAGRRAVRTARAAAPAAGGRPDLADVRGQAGRDRGAHDCRRRRPPPAAQRPARHRQDDARAPAAGHPAAADAAEALEVPRIRSVAGLRTGGRWIARVRPFRAPHHTISASGLVGGGAAPRPGEVTLAHRGVLFLDELAEFSRSALEALRQPLEDGALTIVRGQRCAVTPRSCALVAATNPCPCGYAGSDGAAAAARRRSSGTPASSADRCWIASISLLTCSDPVRRSSPDHRR